MTQTSKPLSTYDRAVMIEEFLGWWGKNQGVMLHEYDPIYDGEPVARCMPSRLTIPEAVAAFFASQTGAKWKGEV